MAKLFLFLLVVANSFSSTAASTTSLCGDQELIDHPVLCQMLQHREQDPDLLGHSIHEWARENHLLVDFSLEYPVPDDTIEVTVGAGSVAAMRHLSEEAATKIPTEQQQLPVVFAHGMGDSCFNSGMQHITAHTSALLNGVYTVCIPTGKSQSEDTSNGYFLNMDASVEVFAQAVQENEHLKDGFHAIGLSQGNNVIRGYLAKINDPPVHTFLAINGVNAGVGAVPYCRPAQKVSSSQHMSFSMCELLMEQASKQAYTEFAQEHSFQANYWRDPRPSMADSYHKYGQLAVWNNEAGFINETLRENWAKTQKFIWVLATEDGMVFPKEGEQWGAPNPADPFNDVLLMKDTEWYQKDLFGLKTAEEAGKNFFESFEGDHLQFEMKDFENWVHKYLDDSHASGK